MWKERFKIHYSSEISKAEQELKQLAADEHPFFWYKKFKETRKEKYKNISTDEEEMPAKKKEKPIFTDRAEVLRHVENPENKYGAIRRLFKKIL